MKKVLITGASGSIGQYLTSYLFKNGYTLILATRNAKKAKGSIPFPVDFIEVDLNRETLREDQIQDVDCIINLAGESVAQGLWTKNKKEKILQSRLQITENIVKSIKDKNIHLIQISGVNIYKESTSDIDEDGSLDNSFLAEVCKSHEKVANGINATVLRLPLILGKGFPVLQSLGTLYRFCLGAEIISKNHIPWIHVHDLSQIIEQIIDKEELRGEVINTVSSYMTQKQFHEALNSCSDRFNPTKVPSALLKLLMGEKSRIVLKDLKVITKFDFSYEFKTIDSAIQDCFSYMKTPTVRKNCFHHQIERYQFLNKKTEEVFEFFCDAKNLERITPKDLSFKIISQSTKEIEEGTRFVYKLSLHRIPFYWTTIIKNWLPPYKFTDYQKKGPYQVWNHTHEFIELNGGTLMKDTVQYRLPLGMLGELFGIYFVKRNVRKIFDYRFKYIEEKFHG